MDKRLIILTESDLHRIVKESVNRLLNEFKKTVHVKKSYRVSRNELTPLILPCADNSIYRWGKDENGKRYLKVNCENGDRAYEGDYLCLGYDNKWYIQKRGNK